MLTTLHIQRNPVLCLFLLFTKDLPLWFIIIFIFIIIIIIITAWNSFAEFIQFSADIFVFIYLLKMLPDTEIGHKPWLIQTFFVLPLSAPRVCVGVGWGRCRRVYGCVWVCVRVPPLPFCIQLDSFRFAPSFVLRSWLACSLIVCLFICFSSDSFASAIH